MNSDILIYKNPDGNIKIDVRLEEETVWLTQAQMGQFCKDKTYCQRAYWKFISRR